MTPRDGKKALELYAICIDIVQSCIRPPASSASLAARTTNRERLWANGYRVSTLHPGIPCMPVHAVSAILDSGCCADMRLFGAGVWTSSASTSCFLQAFTFLRPRFPTCFLVWDFHPFSWLMHGKQCRYITVVVPRELDCWESAQKNRRLDER